MWKTTADQQTGNVRMTYSFGLTDNKQERAAGIDINILYFQLIGKV